METLISDCLLSIFSYLSLSDLLHLRSVSRRLKQEVDDHLPRIRSLPLYLTTPRTPEDIAIYEHIIRSDKGYDRFHRLSNKLYLRRLSFGTSGLETFEDGTILKNQRHFRSSDFLVINNSSKLQKFLPLIKKLCPNIEKLALVIDDCKHYLSEVTKVLQAFLAIKVLFMERTFQDSCRYDDYRPINRQSKLHNLPYCAKNEIWISSEVFNAILALNSLQELYFFSKRNSQLKMSYRAGSEGRNFVKSILRRLRVFHYNTAEILIDQAYSESCIFKLSIEDLQLERGYELLEELACTDIELPYDPYNDIDDLRIYRIFPSLKKLIIHDFGMSFWFHNLIFDRLPGPSLKVLDFKQNNLNISRLGDFNSLPALEQICCRSINEQFEFRRKRKDMNDHRIVTMNRTVKHLQVINGPETAEDRKQTVRRYSKYFVALETCVFLEPQYSVVWVNDL